MASGKRLNTGDPLTEHDVAERLDRAAIRVVRIMADTRQLGAMDPVKASRYLTNSLNILASELALWGVTPDNGWPTHPLAALDADAQRLWHSRVDGLIGQALNDARSDRDPIPALSAAIAAARIEVGELPAGELDDYPFPGEDTGPDCICAPEQRARGGFKGDCPACCPT